MEQKAQASAHLKASDVTVGASSSSKQPRNERNTVDLR
jgi:hypothetical protein